MTKVHVIDRKWFQIWNQCPWIGLFWRHFSLMGQLSEKGVIYPIFQFTLFTPESPSVWLTLVCWFHIWNNYPPISITFLGIWTSNFYFYYRNGRKILGGNTPGVEKIFFITHNWYWMGYQKIKAFGCIVFEIIDRLAGSECSWDLNKCATIPGATWERT